MTGIRDYSPTADANLAVAGISLAEGWARASVNNAFRAEMADIADLLLDMGGAKVTTGTASAYLVSLDTAPTAYANNMLFLATAHVTNANGATININGIGVKPIKKIVSGVASGIVAGDFPAGHIGIFTYSSSKNAVILLTGARTGEFDTVADMLADGSGAQGEGTVWEADGFRYREADPAATDHHLTTAGGVKLYCLPGDSGWYNFLAMNPARDGVTNDAAKLNKLLAIRPMGPEGPTNLAWPQGPSIFFPSGIYYMDAGPWGFQIKAITRLMGEGNGIDNNLRNTSIVFPKDVVGFMFNHHDSFEDIQEPPDASGFGTGGAKGSIVERLTVRVTASDVALGSNVNAHGIWIRTTVHLRDVTVYGFYGHGIAITGSSGTQPNPLDHGGPSSFSLANVTSFKNHNCGIFLQGHDTNVGMGWRCDVNNNGRWGIYDDSFSGTIWQMVHSEVNGLALRGGNPADGSSMVYIAEGDGTNSIYYAKSTATPAQLVAVTPGTDATVWAILPGFSHYTGSIGTNYALWTAGKPTGTYFAGGCFWSGNLAARNMFIGCYSEGDAPGYLGGVAMAFGGVAKWQPGSAFYGFSSNLMTTASGYRVTDDDSNQITIGGDPNSSATLFRALSYKSVAEAVSWIWQYSATSGDYALQYAGAQNAHFLTTINTTQKMGTSKTQPYLMHFPVLAVGGSTTARRQSTNNVKPTTGEYAAGDVVWNAAASTTSYAGWLCSSAGIASGSATAWAAGTNYAINAYVQATNTKYYRCSVDAGGVIVAANEPSHASGEVIGADGFGWTFVSNAAAEFLPFGATVSQQTLTTDAAFTLTPLTSPRFTRHTGVLTANRAVTLTTASAYAGQSFRITRTGVDAFALNVGTGPLKPLTTNTWCEVVFDGTAWNLSACGAL